jgi:hypothetical protein
MRARIQPLLDALKALQGFKNPNSFTNITPNGQFQINPVLLLLPQGQQKDVETCGYWAILNALHPILYGNIFVPDLNTASPKTTLENGLQSSKIGAPEILNHPNKNEIFRKIYA